jgi:3-oxoadipate enol-lactonase
MKLKVRKKMSKNRINEIPYAIEGNGPVLILVNMQFQNIETWTPIVEYLKRFYKVVRFQFPNQGLMDQFPQYDSIIDYANCLRLQIKKLEIDTTTSYIFGYSFGAHVIRALSLEQNIRFKGIIIGGINPIDLKEYYGMLIQTWEKCYQLGGIEFFAEALSMRLFSPLFLSKNPSVVGVIKKSLITYYSGKENALLAILNSPRNYLLSPKNFSEDYKSPVYVIAGSDDLIIPAYYSHEYAKKISASGYFELKEVGHKLEIEARIKLCELIDEIICTVEEL